MYIPALCCLMITILSKDIPVMYDHTFLNLQITRSDIKVTHKVGSQLGGCIWSLKIFLRGWCGYAWVNILYHSGGENIQ